MFGLGRFFGGRRTSAVPQVPLKTKPVVDSFDIEEIIIEPERLYEHAALYHIDDNPLRYIDPYEMRQAVESNDKDRVIALLEEHVTLDDEILVEIPDWIREAQEEHGRQDRRIETKSLCNELGKGRYVLNRLDRPVVLNTGYGSEAMEELFIRERERVFVTHVEGHATVTYIGDSDPVNYYREEKITKVVHVY